MRNVIKLFISDINSIASHIFVVMMVSGILILPSLYAWINIYANGDPYENTGRIPVAVSSDDKGTDLDDGTHVNNAIEEIESLKDRTSLNWSFVGDPKKAIQDVRSGKYYAAVIFEDGFSYNMNHPSFAVSNDKDCITYYSNTKKGSIAAKITDSAVNSLLDDINLKYSRSILKPYITNATNFSADIDIVDEIRAAKKQLLVMKSAVKEYNTAMASFSSISKNARSNISTVSQNIHSLQNETTDKINSAKNSYQDFIDKLYEMGFYVTEYEKPINRLDTLIDSVNNTTAAVDPVLLAADNTLNNTSESLTIASRELVSIENEIDKAVKKLNKLNSTIKKYKKNSLKLQDVKSYVNFFTSPVTMKTTTFYTISAYGIAMTPFYSVLGIWVGVVMLASLLNTHANRDRHPEMTENECFFGRYLIFALLSQIQTAVIMAGDILLLNLKPADTGLLFFAAAFISIAFSMLLYSIVHSFGDFGKGAIVVLMVLQIAGSGGSFPIEILPEPFQAIYRFFPFPYAINALREAICGPYKNDYIIDLAKVSVFGIIGLMIGLFVRKPFIEVNHFLSEKIEETEVI